MSRIPKTQREIERLLRASGIPYRIDQGQKHRKLYISGQLALVFSHGNNDGNDMRQVISLINRMQNAYPRWAVQRA